jgi:hypothetical protein
VQNANIKKLFLYTLIASVSVSALIGIGVVLFGDFGAKEVRVLLTTVTITVISIFGLACGAYLESGRGQAMPIAGIAFSILAGMMLMFIIWDFLDDSEGFIKATVTATIIASACSHLSLLYLARLDRRFAWSRTLAAILVTTIAAILIFFLWADPDNWDDLIWRSLAVLSILLAAVTVMTPVFHKLSHHGDFESIERQIDKLKEQITALENQRDELRNTQT